MSQKRLVIFDVDDTLCFFTAGFNRWMAEKFKCPVRDPATQAKYVLMEPFKRHTNWTAIEALKDFESTNWFREHMEPTGHMKLLKRFIAHGVYDVMLLTARGWMKNPIPDTQAWMTKNGVDKKDYQLHVLELHESKADFINKLNRDVSLVLDDNPHHLEEILAKCKQVETISISTQAWNQHLQDGFVHLHPGNPQL